MSDLRPAFFAALDASADDIELHARVSRWLEIPPSLGGLAKIVENLPEILDTWVNPFDLKIAEADEISQWVARTRRALDNAKFRRQLPRPSYVIDKGSGEQALRVHMFLGIMESNAVWTTLWFSSGSGFHEQFDRRRHVAYREIQGIFLAAHVRLASLGRTLDWPERWYDASLLLRSLHQPILAADLDEWAKSSNTVSSAYRYFAQRHANLENPVDVMDRRRKQGFGALADIVSQGFELGHSSVFESRLGTTASRRRRTRSENSDLDLIFDDHCYYWIHLPDSLTRLGEPYTPVRTSIVSPGTTLAGEFDKYGIDPGEYAKPVGYFVPTDDLVDAPGMGSASPGELPPLGALFVAVKARARWERMRAQRLTTRIGRIRPRTLVKIIRTMESLYAEANVHRERLYADAIAQIPDDLDLVRALEWRCRTLRLLAVSLFTGTPPEEAVEVEVLRNERLDRYTGLVFDYSNRIWYRPCLRPDRKRRRGEIHAGLIPTTDWLALSDAWLVGWKNLPCGGRLLAFGGPIEEYRRQFELMRPRFEAEGIPPDYCRFDAFGELIRGWMDGREEGAQLRTAIVFGRRDLAAETQRYYSAFHWTGLDAYFMEGLDRLRREMIAEGLVIDGALFDFTERAPVTLPTKYCGDDLVPTGKAVQGLVAELKIRVRALVDYSRPEALNLATIYLAFVMAIVTGYRQYRTPVPDLRLISRRTGLLSLQEKDCDDGSHARCVLIPQALRVQIDRYLQLLRYFWTTTDYRGAPVLKVPASKHRDASRFNAKSYSLSLLHTFALFEQTADGASWQPVELQGESLARVLNAILPGAWSVINGGRHYIRSALERLNVPPNLINAHLGHWGAGEGPWHPESGFDPLHYRNAIEPYLTQVLKVIGFEPIDYLAAVAS